MQYNYVEMHPSHLDSQRCSITTQKWTLATWIRTLANWRWILVTWRWTLATQSALQGIHSPSPGCKNPSRVHLIIYVARVHFQAAKAHHQVARVHLQVTRVHFQVTRVHLQVDIGICHLLVTRGHLQVTRGHCQVATVHFHVSSIHHMRLASSSRGISFIFRYTKSTRPSPSTQSISRYKYLQAPKVHLQVPRDKSPFASIQSHSTGMQRLSPGVPSLSQKLKDEQTWKNAWKPQETRLICLKYYKNNFLTIPLTQNWTHQ